MLATLVTVSLVMFALIWYFRSALALGALSWSLAVGTLATFAFTELAIGHLNLATAFLSSIVIGNGIIGACAGFIFPFPARTALVVGAGLGERAAERERVAGAGQCHVRDGGPHRPLVGVRAADPPAQQEQLGEELLPHLLALRGERVGWGHADHSSRRNAIAA